MEQNFPTIKVDEIWSKKLLPDSAILVGKNIYIIEVKYQSGSGSVDEKLQTCDFKKKQYERLLTKTDLEVHLFYILNDWFKCDKYRDSLNYIVQSGCKYFFNQIPLEKLGL